MRCVNWLNEETQWLLPEIVIVVQKALLAEHGGSTGIQDEIVFASAMARPKQSIMMSPRVRFMNLRLLTAMGWRRTTPSLLALYI